MCGKTSTAATFVQIKKKKPNNDKSDKVDRGTVDKNTMISIHYKDEIVKINVLAFNKLLVKEVLSLVFQKETNVENIVKYVNRLMVVNSNSIMDNVMEYLRNDIPETNRYNIDLGTLFDPQMISRIISVHSTMKNNLSLAIEDKKNENAFPTAVPLNISEQNMQTQIKNKCLPNLPTVAPHNSLSTWKHLPSAPILNIEQKNDKLLLSWNMKSIYQMAKIQFYELYFCQQTKFITENSKWEKIQDIEANKLPMFLEIDCLGNKGQIYYYILRAVDVHERRGPFAFHKLSL